MSEGVQLVIPMAGEGRRFLNAGVQTPKPLIDVGGIRMFELVIANLISAEVSQIVLIVRAEFELESIALQMEQKLGVPIKLVSVEQTTLGPAKSVALTEDLLQANAPVVVANSDQYVRFDPKYFYETLVKGISCSGVILTMEDDDPQWSYADLTADNDVIRVVEKQVVSPYATVGIYGFRRASEMFRAFEEMERMGDKVGGEFYVGPAYNYLSKLEGPVKSMNLGPVGLIMHGLGTPDDLKRFLATSDSAAAIRRARAILAPTIS
ncbi:RfbA dTDP-glucose pyrophosphorylase [Microbacteriaceae bacterium]